MAEFLDPQLLLAEHERMEKLLQLLEGFVPRSASARLPRLSARIEKRLPSPTVAESRESGPAQE